VEASSAPGSEEETPEERGRSLRTAAMITAAVGALHALLFLLAWWLLSDPPGADATDAEIVDYYGSSSSRPRGPDDDEGEGDAGHDDAQDEEGAPRRAVQYATTTVPASTVSRRVRPHVSCGARMPRKREAISSASTSA
jgi:hypothetical protein